jgi:hypothetical protein
MRVNFPLTLALSLWGREDYSRHWDFELDLKLRVGLLKTRYGNAKLSKFIIAG